MSYRDNAALNELRDCLRRPYKAYISDFLDEREQAQLMPLLKRSQRDYRFDGGYEEAGRKVLIVAPENEFAQDQAVPLSAIIFDKPCELNHRNILGTLMSLGVSRDVIGDIAIWDETVQIVVLDRMAEYFLNTFHNVNGREIKPEIYAYNEIIPYSAPYDRETGTAASNRLDAVIATAFKTSRAKAAQALRQNLVLYNHLPITKPTQAVKADDTISLRGKGKIKIVQIGQKTKKGRIRFDFLRYK